MLTASALAAAREEVDMSAEAMAGAATVAGGLAAAKASTLAMPRR